MILPMESAMRTVFALLLCLFLVPYVGCGGRPDPRDNPDFVDDTDPNMATEALPAPSGDPGAPQQPAGAPSE